MAKNVLDGQVILKQVFHNAIKKNQLSHAYLIQTNNVSYYEEVVNEILKMILCDQYEPGHSCSLCKRIEDGNYLEIRKIYPDGLWIKKEQLSDLKKEFNNKVLEGKYKIYVIYEADKLNKQAANSMLKFLEEPEDNIIAILLTNNMNKMLKTIISRCQVLMLLNPNVIGSTIHNYLGLYHLLDKNDEVLVKEKQEELDKIIHFISYLEENKLFTFAKEKELWLDFFKERDTNIIGYSAMLYFYNDCVKYLSGNHSLFFIDYMDMIQKVSSCNDMDKLFLKIEFLLDAMEWLRGNVNVNLILDLLIISFRR